jgi:exportin-2 (importin alpha re-exporter)
LQPTETSGDVIAISDAERDQIKNALVDLMVAVPPAVQRQLSEALSIISQSDFPHKWQNLLPVRLLSLQQNRI